MYIVHVCAFYNLDLPMDGENAPGLLVGVPTPLWFPMGVVIVHVHVLMFDLEYESIHVFS